MRQRPRDGHTLLLAAGELVGIGRKPIAEPDAVEQRLGARARIAGRAVQLQRQRDIFEHRQRRDEIEELKDDADVAAAEERALLLAERGQVEHAAVLAEDHAAAAGRIDAGDEVEQRALAAARLAKQADKLAGVELAVQRVEHGAAGAPFAIDLGQPLQADQRRAIHRPVVAGGCPVRLSFQNECSHNRSSLLAQFVCSILHRCRQQVCRITDKAGGLMPANHTARPYSSCDVYLGRRISKQWERTLSLTIETML